MADEAESKRTNAEVDFDAVLITLTLHSARSEPTGVCPLLRPCKNPALMRAGFYMVEARGVEPLSENIATQASTGVLTDLMSPGHRPVTGYALGQPDCLLPLDPRRRPNGVFH